MRCPNHPQNDVTGYCTTCAAFGCGECLTEHEGQLLCQKHYRPIAQKLEEDKRHAEVRKRHARQRLVVRFLDGRIMRGFALALSPKDTSFHLDGTDDNGVAREKTLLVRFSELKAVFNVKSFDGKFNRSVQYKEWAPEGSEVVVKFKDGEIFRGFLLHRFDPDDPRFYVVPRDSKSNNISVLVEMAAVERLYTLEEYEAELATTREANKNQETTSDLTQEETMGDFMFETRNYEGALANFRMAAKRFPQSHRLRKKVLVAHYNIGVQHIKRHEYAQALERMEEILKTEPNNTHARKKVLQLRRILEAGPKESPEKSLVDETQ